ncbi:MAG TPA: hypothetical protein VEQ11_19265 [Chloroflexota bacterium]|nr:hypothetical protein [Chloroflexota bacterium]
METVVVLHSFWRWAVLLAAVVGLVGSFGGWLGVLPPLAAARRAAAVYTIALDIQVLLGLVLWVGKGWYGVPGFYRLEHPTIMLLALVVAHAGQIVARRAAQPTAAARSVAFGTAVSLVLVVIGIPGVMRPA